MERKLEDWREIQQNISRDHPAVDHKSATLSVILYSEEEVWKSKVNW